MNKNDEVEELSQLLVQEWFAKDQIPLEAAKNIIAAGYSRKVALDRQDAEQHANNIWEQGTL